MLDVVDGERVPGQQDIHVAGANQIAEMLRSPGMHEHRTGDERNRSARALHVRHHRGNTCDGHFHTTLR